MHSSQPPARRLLVVVAESRVLLHDLVTRAVREVPRGALEGKAPTCCAFLFQGGQVGVPWDKDLKLRAQVTGWSLAPFFHAHSRSDSDRWRALDVHGSGHAK